MNYGAMAHWGGGGFFFQKKKKKISFFILMFLKDVLNEVFFPSSWSSSFL